MHNDYIGRRVNAVREYKFFNRTVGIWKAAAEIATFAVVFAGAIIGFSVL